MDKMLNSLNNQQTSVLEYNEKIRSLKESLKTAEDALDQAKVELVTERSQRSREQNERLSIRDIQQGISELLQADNKYRNLLRGRFDQFQYDNVNLNKSMTNMSISLASLSNNYHNRRFKEKSPCLQPLLNACQNIN